MTSKSESFPADARVLPVPAAELIVDLAGLERIAPAWDALAVAQAQPCSAPAWMLAWWRHVAPSGAQLRAVAVREGDELIGVVPLCAEPGTSRLRLLASAEDFSPSLTPLAAPGRVDDVAAAAAALLARERPRAAELELGPIPVAAPWTAALRARWPGRPRPLRFRRDVQEAASIALHDGSLDAWLAARDYRFRKNARRSRRLFEDAGGTSRWTTAQTLDADVEAFVRLHAARWEGIGDSRLVALGERLAPFLRELAHALLPAERFRMLVLELDGETICADLWIAAGGEVAGINTGWDERHRRLSPPTVASLLAIEDCLARGERRVQLGFGRLDYKRAWANGSERVAWDRLLLPGRALPRTLARNAPAIASRWLRTAAKRALPPQQADRLRALRDRLGITPPSR
jgi:CelD/BcsL family acetyltransferase involved in cellulose biosynthesis